MVVALLGATAEVFGMRRENPLDRRNVDLSPDLERGLRVPPFVGLTLRTRRVINGCFVQGGQDQGLTSPVGCFELIPARNPTRPSSALLQVLRWKRVRNSGNN